MKKPVIAGIAVVVIILGIVIYSSMNLMGHRVEVCLTYNGLSRCKIASGSTEEFATRTAHDNACGEIASGVTDTMGCGRTTPTKVTVLK
ncbi:MAG: hypothetical protein ABI824_05915 [Acidobacteriota bacterium]